MKIYQVLLILLCINYIYSVTVDCRRVENPSKETCNAGLSEEDKEDGKTHCCFIRFKRSGAPKDETLCSAITEYQYKNIDELAKYFSLFEIATDDFNIECSSIFVKFSFLSLILLLL